MGFECVDFGRKYKNPRKCLANCCVGKRSCWEMTGCGGGVRKAKWHFFRLAETRQARVPEHALRAPNWLCGHDVSTKQAPLSYSWRTWSVSRSTKHIGPWHLGHCQEIDSSAPGDRELSGGGAWSNARQSGNRSRRRRWAIQPK